MAKGVITGVVPKRGKFRRVHKRRACNKSKKHKQVRWSSIPHCWKSTLRRTLRQGLPTSTSLVANLLWKAVSAPVQAALLFLLLVGASHPQCRLLLGASHKMTEGMSVRLTSL
jgi:hypothetical protein